MYKEQTLYQHLYHSLVLQIQSGVYLQQRFLPSQKILCQQYNVGLTTIRKVTKLLHENGFIEAASGQSARIIYQAPIETYMSVLIARKEQIDDAFLGLGMLLPHLYKEAAKHCPATSLSIMEQIIEDIDASMDMLSLYQQINLFMTTLLQSLHNPFMMDLELDAENYLHVPYLPYLNTVDPFYRTAKTVKTWLQQLYTYIITQQEDALCIYIMQTYQHSQERVRSYIQKLESHVIADKSAYNETLSWFHIKERSELYAHIAMKLLRRIIKGEFSGQKYIPSIPAIMKEYGVMKETASRSIALLNALGITQSIHKKGTMIRMDTSQTAVHHIDFHNPVIVQRITYCMDALQLIAFSMDMELTFDKQRKQTLKLDIQHCLQHMTSSYINPLLVQLFMDFIMHALPAHSLKNIFEQLNDLLVWGYYLKAVDASLYADQKKTMQAIDHLLHVLDEQDDKVIAKALQRIFLQIYRDIYAQLLKMPEPFTQLPMLL